MNYNYTIIKDNYTVRKDNVTVIKYKYINNNFKDTVIHYKG